MVAVVESIVFLLQSNIEAIESHAAGARDIEISGGLARLDGLCHRLAALSGRSVLRAAQTETSARGAAWLLTEATQAWAEAGTRQRFAPAEDTALRERYRRWRDALATQIGTGQ